jgi:hypothetical protein
MLKPTTDAFAPERSNRRREPRYATTDTAEVGILLDPTSRRIGRVIDVSRSGLRIALPTPLDPGIEVRITFRRPTVIVGEVRHCARAGDEFHIGIAIRDVLISPNRHVDDDELALYVSGKGLTEAEFFYVRLHFADCEECSGRLQEQERSTDQR